MASFDQIFLCRFKSCEKGFYKILCYFDYFAISCYIIRKLPTYDYLGEKKMEGGGCTVDTRLMVSSITLYSSVNKNKISTHELL